MIININIVGLEMETICNNVLKLILDYIPQQDYFNVLRVSKRINKVARYVFLHKPYTLEYINKMYMHTIAKTIDCHTAAAWHAKYQVQREDTYFGHNLSDILDTRKYHIRHSKGVGIAVMFHGIKNCERFNTINESRFQEAWKVAQTDDKAVGMIVTVWTDIITLIPKKFIRKGKWLIGKKDKKGTLIPQLNGPIYYNSIGSYRREELYPQVFYF